MKINETGRSMIEMLGVLAIVGVLSVGGIAGYSQAMSKYKINKLVEEYNLVVQDITLWLDKINRAYGKGLELLASNDEKNNIQLASLMTENQSETFSKNAKLNRGVSSSLVPFLISINSIPKSWRYEKDILYDSMGGKVSVTPGVFITTTLTNGSAKNVRICENLLLNVAKNNDVIKVARVFGTANIRDEDAGIEMRSLVTGSNAEGVEQSGMKGYSAKDLTVSTTAALCSLCKKEECSITMKIQESEDSKAQANAGNQGGF